MLLFLRLRVKDLPTAIGAAVGAGAVGQARLFALWANPERRQLQVKMRTPLALSRVRRSLFR
jgi:F0F1-type ATP synthase membrane subunit c/vacuolar-type H+-ATPase subunit K